MKRVLIIGVAGFVGDHLADYLQQNGYAVYATKLKHEIYAREDVVVSDMEILDMEEMTRVLNAIKPDVIFHLAAQSSVALSWENPQLTVDINIKGVINLLEVIKRVSFSPKLILIGSGEEYGYSFNNISSSVNEETHLKPANIYAVSKAAQNMLGALYAGAYKMDIINVRAFNHIGPKQTEQFVVSSFCKQIAKIEKGLQEPYIKVGNLSAKRDFTDVRDIVRAYGILAKHGVSGETYNIGSGRSVSIQDVLDALLSLTNVSIEIIVDKDRLRPSDIPSITVDTSKIRVLGWKPLITLQQSLIDVLFYWRCIA
jgi:GDP-4-dehydro-6-deoxy-D-mannose reductase